MEVKVVVMDDDARRPDGEMFWDDEADLGCLSFEERVIHLRRLGWFVGSALLAHEIGHVCLRLTEAEGEWHSVPLEEYEALEEAAEEAASQIGLQLLAKYAPRLREIYAEAEEAGPVTISIGEGWARGVAEGQV